MLLPSVEIDMVVREERLMRDIAGLYIIFSWMWLDPGHGDKIVRWYCVRMLKLYDSQFNTKLLFHVP